MSAATRRRRRPRLPRLRGGRLHRPRLSARLMVGSVVVAGALVGGFFWVRSSSLVAVRRVTITGVSGPDATAIRGALAGAARGMSTIDLGARRLREAVAPYPVVRALRLHSDFPHGLRIGVVERIPVAVLLAGGQRTVLAADGSLLRGARLSMPLPAITAAVVPGGSTVSGTARADVVLLAAAPYPLLARIATAGLDSGARGLEVGLRNGPAIYFGAPDELAAKWRAAVAVLANQSSAGASYIDVTDPARPTAGAGSDRNSTSSAG